MHSDQRLAVGHSGHPTTVWVPRTVRRAVAPRVLGVRLGGVEHAAQVCARDVEHVAIERQRCHLWVIDDLARSHGHVAHGSGLPQFGEEVALRSQPCDQPAHPMIGGILVRGRAQLGDLRGLEREQRFRWAAPW
jgi:hypothetical protein